MDGASRREREAAYEKFVWDNLKRNYAANYVHGMLGMTGFRLVNAPTFIPAYLHMLARAAAPALPPGLRLLAQPDAVVGLGLALGARADTFMGLSGLGDLVLTATGDLSRNRKVGLLLAQGMAPRQAADSLGHVAEGVYCARTVVQRAARLGVEMPISQAVDALLAGQLAAGDAVAALMGREPRHEHL